MSPSRRDFLIAASGAFAAAPRVLQAQSAANMMRSAAPSRVVLFQGDSITDCSRDRTNNGAGDVRGLGTGYPALLAGMLRDIERTRTLQIFNRGVSGNTVTDLQARWPNDTVALRPDLLSILIGVNDIWHTLDGTYNGTPEKYQSGYAALLADTRKTLPAVKLVVMEPFVLRTGAVTDKWFPEFDRFRSAAKQVAHDAGATFVPLHDTFQQLARTGPPAYWLGDGVHPTPAGHAVIAEEWLRTVHI